MAHRLLDPQIKSHPLTPALSPKGGEGEREQIFVESNPEFDWRTQAGTDRTINPVIPSPFKRREGSLLGAFQILSPTRHVRSAYSEIHLGQSPLPLGEG